MEKYLQNIKNSNKDVYLQAKKHLDFLAKPLGSLGELEEISAKLCSIYNTLNINVDKKKILLSETIKVAGTTNVDIKLNEGVMAKVQVMVVPK